MTPNNQNKENLKELLGKFYNMKQSEDFLNDLNKTEQILQKYTSPAPDTQLLNNIKSRLERKLQRRCYIRITTYRVTAIAATILIASVISLSLFKEIVTKPQQSEVASIQYRQIWENAEAEAQDMTIAVLTTEIEQIESDLIAVKSSATDGNGNTDIIDAETELIEINSDFWKG